ncbi:MAG: DUF1836 domain-containing protein [Acholeplasmatales bacterium]|nr:DUF1836 domain-containing protein [Acholeplasmatales bacterium]
MDDIKKSLENWLNDLNNFSFQNYENLPDFELYMDQVMKYLDRQLYIFQTTTSDKQITSSMINNYVKGEVIPAPVSKRYTREHLAYIQEVCTLKQVLSIAEVKQILDKTYAEGHDKATAYDEFNYMNSTITSEVVDNTFKKLNDVDANDIDALNKIALDYAVTANAYIEVAKRILFLNRNFEYTQKIREAQAKEDAERAEKERKKAEKKAAKEADSNDNDNENEKESE